jgi:DNA replication protein DnaC
MNKREEKDLFINDLYAKAKSVCISKVTIDSLIPTSSKRELDYLSKILNEENDNRQTNKISKLLKQAGFPVFKTFNGFDFSGINFPGNFSKEDMLSLNFIDKKEVILFYGVCGSGKTHNLIALGMNACKESYKVKFYTLSELVLFLKKAKQEDKLARFYTMLSKQDLICIDEFGYIPMDLEAGQLLFQVISAAYERQALLLSTNLPFSSWGPLFADEQLAAAIVDRIVHHGYMINTGNNDWRLSHSTMASC